MHLVWSHKIVGAALAVMIAWPASALADKIEIECNYGQRYTIDTNAKTLTGNVGYQIKYTSPYRDTHDQIEWEVPIKGLGNNGAEDYGKFGKYELDKSTLRLNEGRYEADGHQYASEIELCHRLERQNP
jgi:hypothetical protein